MQIQVRAKQAASTINLRRHMALVLSVLLPVVAFACCPLPSTNPQARSSAVIIANGSDLRFIQDEKEPQVERRVQKKTGEAPGLAQ